MKAYFIVALLLAIAAFVSAVDYTATTLESGTAVTGLATSSDNTVCTYYRLVVPAGTGAVQVDVTNAAANSYVSVTAGFNTYPAADQDTEESGDSYLFYDNNVNGGSTGRYFVCAYEDVHSSNVNFGTTSSGANSGYCAAWVPDMHNGGEFYVCLSAWSDGTALTGLELTLTAIPAVEVALPTTVATWEYPANADTNGALYAYKMWIPANTTEMQITTSDSDLRFFGAGTWNNAWTSGNTLTFGRFVTDAWVILIGITRSSTAETANLRSDQTCDGVETFSYTDDGFCLTTYPLTSGVANNTLYTTSTNGGSYRLYTMTVPAATETAKFYTLQITIDATFYGNVYVSGETFYGFDSSVNAPTSFARYTSLTWTDNTAAAHYLMPNTEVYINVYSGYSDQNVTFTATFVAESLTNVVIGTATLTAGTEVSTATPATAGLYYVTATPFTADGSYYKLDIDSADVSQAGVAIVSTDFNTTHAVLGGASSSSSTKFTFAVTNLPAGNYYILGYPYTTGSRTVTISATTFSPSSASMAVPSIAMMIVAFIVALVTLF